VAVPVAGSRYRDDVVVGIGEQSTSSSRHRTA
jgi:hypothetical protein